MTSVAVRRLLCATDLSPASLPAWEEARVLAALLGAEVVLLHVAVPPLPPGLLPGSLTREIRDAAHRAAQEGLARLLEGGDAGRAKLTVRVEDGPAARQILEVAAEEAADLLVVGTHGRSAPGRAALGSVADRVVRLAPCPVLTVPGRAGAASPGPPRIARVCFATDFSPAAAAAWPWAVLLAEAAAAEVDLLHVTPLPAPGQGLGAETIGRMAQLLHAEAEAEAERFLRACPLPRERVHVRVGRGTPGEEILRWARERAADLIVLGTHGWSGFLRWTLGSVTHHVLHAAACPVLSVGAGGRTEERPNAA